MIRVLICDDQQVVREGLRAVLTRSPKIQVVGEAGDGAEALALLPAGKTPVDPAVAGKLFAHVARSAPVDTRLLAQLTEREREVLALLARGLSNAEIAQSVHLSEGTVRNYVSAILGKLGAADRTQAAVLALRAGLVDQGDDH